MPLRSRGVASSKGAGRGFNVVFARAVLIGFHIRSQMSRVPQTARLQLTVVLINGVKGTIFFSVNAAGLGALSALSKSKGWDVMSFLLIVYCWNDTEFLTLPPA